MMVTIFERFETEMRRGVIQVAVMCLLENEMYGYDIMKKLKNTGLNVEEGTLYPLLRRLENNDLLTSRWDTNDTRPRKYYKITEYGTNVRGKWLDSLNTINSTVKEFEKNIHRENE